MSAPVNPLTQACEDRDFVEWHRGCPWCAVWVLRVDKAQVQALVASVRDRLVTDLLPRYERQAHVTVAYRGLMAQGTNYPYAEYTPEHLLRDVERLQALQLPPFELQIQGVGSFSTVPYLAVVAEGALSHLHVAMRLHAADPDWSYAPHVTVGHYGRRVPMELMMERMQSGVAPGVLWQTKISEIWLARYRTNDIAGPLYWEGRFDLHSNTYRAEAGALWTSSHC